MFADRPEMFTYIISSDNKKCDFLGRLPVGDDIVPVELIDEEKKEPREGNFYVEHRSGSYIVFEMKENRREIVHTLVSRAPPSSRTVDSFFSEDRNSELIDSIISELEDNETYIEVESPEAPRDNARPSIAKKPRFSLAKFTVAKVIRKRYIKSVREKLYILKGFPQSCKSGVMAQLGIKLARAGKSSVIIFRAEGDRVQFISRLRQMMDDIRNHTRKNIKITVVSAKDDFSPTNFLRALTGETPTIYLLVGNDTQLTRLNDAFSGAFSKSKEEAMSTYALIIDEADWVDSDTRVMTGTRKGERTLKSIAIEKIKKYSYAILEVSATILDIAARDDVIPSHVKLLSAPRTYRGIPSFTIVNTERATFSRFVADDWLHTDAELSKILEEFFKKTWKWVNTTRRCRHPNIMLVSSGSCVEPQLKLLYSLKERYPNSTLMVHVGEGVHLYNPNLNSPFSVHEEEKRSTMEKGIHLFSDSCPGSVLLWLKRNMMKEETLDSLRNIVIISGDMAGRSTSYACKDPGAELPFWHLTAYRLVLAASSSAPNVIQKAARLATVFESPIPLVLYVSRQDEEAIILSHYLQEEYIERSKSFPDEDYLKTILANISMYTNKFPKGRDVTTTGVLKPKKVRRKNDGGWDMSRYSFDEDLEHISDEDESDEETSLERTSIPEQEYVDWFMKNTKRSLLSGANTVVVRILKWFKIHGGAQAVITDSELRHIANSERVTANYTRWDISRGQYKMLVSSVNGCGYTMNPILESILESVQLR